MKVLKKEIKNNRGITLVALIVTIIMLLILTGITISQLTGENGLLKNVKTAKEKTIIAKEKEAISLAWNSLIGDRVINGMEITNVDFENRLKNDGNDVDVQYDDEKII